MAVQIAPITALDGTINLFNIEDVVQVSWPSTLPQSPRAWQEEMVDNLIRTQVSAGPPKVRRRFTASRIQARASFILKREQYDTLKQWFESELEHGVQAFSFRNPNSNTLQAFRLLAAPSIESVQGVALAVEMEMEEVV